MWMVKTQFAQPMEGSTEPEWSAVAVETEAEAEEWWRCRTQGKSSQRRVHTMTDPSGKIVRVQFD